MRFSAVLLLLAGLTVMATALDPYIPACVAFFSDDQCNTALEDSDRLSMGVCPHANIGILTISAYCSNPETLTLRFTTLEDDSETGYPNVVHLQTGECVPYPLELAPLDNVYYYALCEFD